MERDEIIEEIVNSMHKTAEVMEERVYLEEDETDDADNRTYSLGYSCRGGSIVTIEMPHPMFDESMLEDLREPIFEDFYILDKELMTPEDLVLTFMDNVIEVRPEWL